MNKEAQEALELYVYRVTGMTPRDRAMKKYAEPFRLLKEISLTADNLTMHERYLVNTLVKYFELLQDPEYNL